MFIPIVAAFPFVPVFCDERSGGAIRQSIVRTGKFRYCFSKFTASLMSGGFAVTLGYLVFSVIVLIAFPSVSNYVIDPDFHPAPNGTFVYLLQKCGGVFLYGVISSVLAFFLSSILHNKYLIMCLPFLMKYLIDQTLIRIRMDLSAQDLSHLVPKTFIFSFDSALRLSTQDENFIWIVIYYSLLLILGFVGFYFIMGRRLDAGA